jgi:nickel/cobalt transporter (NicO) family protein
MPCSTRYDGCLTSSSGRVVWMVAVLALGCAAPVLASGDHGDDTVRVQHLFSGLQGRFSTAALAAAFGLAVAWGAGHALSPGHGKALVGAYLIQSRGRYVDAVWLGLIVTLTHTLSVIGLGLIFAWVLRAEQDREDVLYYLEVASGVLVIAFGLWLLLSRSLALAGSSSSHASHADHDHPHRHAHPHPHEAVPHDHAHAADRGAGGHHPAGGDIAHSHGHGLLAHTHRQVDERELTRFAQGYRDPQARVRWGELLALGVSGGIVPCPSALVIVLLGLHFRAPWTAIALVVAFSVGLAAVLMGIGCMLVGGRRFAARSARATAWLRVAPVFSAAIILLVGVGMVVTAIARHGLPR